jgi:hypothetical protein
LEWKMAGKCVTHSQFAVREWADNVQDIEEKLAWGICANSVHRGAKFFPTEAAG